jgi:formate-dependent nitrite reductase membrane component NrfD
MVEVNITGTNAITYPHLNIWDWTIGMYLFLGGLTAGVMIISATLQLREKSITSTGDRARACYLGPILSFLMINIGVFFVFIDITKKINAFWFYLHFNPTSPMSWGAWGVGIIIPLTFIWGIASLEDKHLPFIAKWKVLVEIFHKFILYRLVLARINLSLGIFLGIYTGILLSFFVARPLWNNALLPILFMASGLSAGTALLIIIAKDNSEKLYLTKIDVGLIGAEIIIILLFFASQLTSTAPHVAAIAPFFTRGFYFPFWIATFLIGIFLPIALVMDIIKISLSRTEYVKFPIFRMHLSAWLVVIGSFIIRQAFVYVGQLSSIMDIPNRW